MTQCGHYRTWDLVTPDAHRNIDFVSGVGDSREHGITCARRTARSWSSILSLLRPLPIALVALAIAIVLWGLGYKLSLYHFRHPDTLHTVVAKLWVDQRWVCSLGLARAQAAGLTATQAPSPKCVDSAPYLPTSLICLRDHEPNACNSSFLFRVLRSPPLHSF